MTNKPKREQIGGLKLNDQQYEMTDVVALKPHPKNPNVGNTEAIEESIRENGFFGAIVAQRSTGHILVGHHHLKAAQEQGAMQVPVLWVDVDDKRALKIMLADNRTAEQGERDSEKLAELLSELRLDGGLTGTGYNEDDLDRLVGELTTALDDAPLPGSADEVDDDKLCTCPKCGFEWQAKA